MRRILGRLLLTLAGLVIVGGCCCCPPVAGTNRPSSRSPNGTSEQTEQLDDDAIYAKAEQLEEQASDELREDQLEAAIKHYREAAGLMQRLQRDGRTLTVDECDLYSTLLYDLACAQARSGQKQAALKALAESVAIGWSDAEHMQSDSDLAPLRDSPAFGELVTRIESLGNQRLAERMAAFEPFAIDFSLTDVEGNPLSLAEYRGKVLIVDFWGTWCPPCREEIPHFIRLYDEYKADGLEIVGLNFEHVTGEEARETIQSYITTEGINYRCAVGTDDVQDQVPDFEGYPTTLFFDRQGRVRYRLVGYHGYAHLNAIVQSLLAE